MRAELKRIISSDVDPETYRPTDDAYCVQLQLLMGPAGEPGEESFAVEVCSPQWLMEESAAGEMRLLRHTILAPVWDFAAIREFILKYVRGCSGETWGELAGKLARLGHWEFEDYREYHSPHRTSPSGAQAPP